MRRSVVSPSRVDDEDEEDYDDDAICWPGQLLNGVVFAIMFGGLGFVLSGGMARGWLSTAGQVGHP